MLTTPYIAMFIGHRRCTYPIPEETGSGVLLLNGQLFGVIFIFTLDKLIPLGDKYVAPDQYTMHSARYSG